MARIELPSPAGARILQVKMLPVADGVTLLWHDVTERTQAEQALKRREDRIALAAEGAERRVVGMGSSEPGVLRRRADGGRWSACRRPTASAVPRNGFTVSTPTMSRRSSRRSTRISRGKTAHFQHEHRIRHEDGTYRRFLCRGIVSRGAGRRPARLAGSLTHLADAARGRCAGVRSDGAGTLDPLTGLCNRAVFVEGLGRRLDVIKARPAGSRFAVLYLDLDRFKVVNDSLGHLVGDELLTAVSRRLESCLRPGDALARLGGDEFAILLNELGDEEQANAIAFRIQDALSAPFSIGGREVFTSASIGIAFGARPVQQPRRDHARCGHRHVSREVARQGAPRAVRCRHARARARPARPRERPAPRRQPQRLRGALSADRAAGLGDVRRVRVAGPVDAQRQAGLAGHVHPDRRGTGPHRAARHVGAPAGVHDVRGLAAPISRRAASTTSPSTSPAGSSCSRIS